MTRDDFNSAWIVYYDSSECAYDVVSGGDWLKRDREDWLHQRMPMRLILELAESETAAIERLKNLLRQRRLDAVNHRQTSTNAPDQESETRTILCRLDQLG